MTRRLVAAALAVCIAAIVASGCGTNTIDDKKAKESVTKQVEAQGVKPNQIKDVSCPSGVESKKGKSYACVVTAVDGSKVKVLYMILDSKGGVRFVSATEVK